MKYELIEIIIESGQSLKDEVNKFLENEGRIVINMTIDKIENKSIVYLLLEGDLNRE